MNTANTGKIKTLTHGLKHLLSTALNHASDQAYLFPSPFITLEKKKQDDLNSSTTKLMNKNLSIPKAIRNKNESILELKVMRSGVSTDLENKLGGMLETGVGGRLEVENSRHSDIPEVLVHENIGLYNSNNVTNMTTTTNELNGTINTVDSITAVLGKEDENDSINNSSKFQDYDVYNFGGLAMLSFHDILAHLETNNAVNNNENTITMVSTDLITMYLN